MIFDLKTALARVEALPVKPAEKRAINRALTKYYKADEAITASYEALLATLHFSKPLYSYFSRGPASPSDLYFALTRAMTPWKFVEPSAVQKAIKADLRKRIKEHSAMVEDFKRQLQAMEQAK